MIDIQYEGLKKIVAITNEHNIDLFGYDLEDITDPETPVEDLMKDDYLSINWPVNNVVNKTQHQGMRKIIEIANTHRLELWAGDGKRITNPNVSREYLAAQSHIGVWYPSKIFISNL